MATHIPVITIDGPSGSGKALSVGYSQKSWGGTCLIAVRFIVFWRWQRFITTSRPKMKKAWWLAAHLDVKFEAEEEKSLTHIIFEGEDVTLTIRTEEVGNMASKIAALPRVREALLRRQRGFKELPGLVADGRDMGTVVFTDADAKVFLTASAEERAQRRFEQLKEKGFDANIDQLINEIKERDDRDMNRSVAPLKPAEDALYLDSTDTPIKDVLEQVLTFAHSKLSETS